MDMYYNKLKIMQTWGYKFQKIENGPSIYPT